MAAQIFIDHSSEAYRREARRAREFIETQLDESRKALEQARVRTIRDLDSLGDTTVLGAIPKMNPSMWSSGE